MIEMIIKDIFKLADKTILTGELITDIDVIKDATVSLYNQDIKVSEVIINGEIRTGNDRDLWTNDAIPLTRVDALLSSKVMLIG